MSKQWVSKHKYINVKLGYQQEQSTESFLNIWFLFIEWRCLPLVQMAIDFYGSVYFIAIWLDEVWGFITAVVVYQVRLTPRYCASQTAWCSGLPNRKNRKVQCFPPKKQKSSDKASFYKLFTLPFFTSLSLSLALSLSQPCSQSMISPPPLLNCHSRPLFFHPILFVHRSALCPSSVLSSVTEAYHSYSRS